MKQTASIAFILIIAILGLAGCASKSSMSDSNTSFSPLSSTSTSAEGILTYNTLPREEQQALDAYAINFSETFSFPFHSTDELDQQLIGYYSFWQIYFEKEEVNAEGICPISKEKLQEYVRSHFDLQTFTYPGDLPEYDEETQTYLFYPLGEGSLVSSHIVEVKKGPGSTIIYTLHLTKESMSPSENPEHTASMTYTYTFRIRKDQDSYALQAVSVE